MRNSASTGSLRGLPTSNCSSPSPSVGVFPADVASSPNGSSPGLDNASRATTQGCNYLGRGSLMSVGSDEGTDKVSFRTVSQSPAEDPALCPTSFLLFLDA